MKPLTKRQKQAWEKWLSGRPDNIRKVAEKLVPWKKYIDTRIEHDIGNRYIPVSYYEDEDGNIKVTCAKTNDEIPFFGGYNVFGIDPSNLIEDESV